MATNELDENHLLELARLLQNLITESNTNAINGIFRQNRIQNPPASKDFLANLNTVTKIKENCPVCLLTFDTSVIVKELPNCGHFFHAECIIPWLEKTNTCPMCRHEYPTDDVEYEEERRLKESEKDKEERLEDLHNSMFS